MSVHQMGGAKLKNDPDVAREILEAMEAHEKDELPMKTSLVPNLNNRIYYFHCRLFSRSRLYLRL